MWEGKNFIDPSCSIGNALQPPTVFDMERTCTTRGCRAVCSETAVTDLSAASAVVRCRHACVCWCRGPVTLLVPSCVMSKHFHPWEHRGHVPRSSSRVTARVCFALTCVVKWQRKYHYCDMKRFFFQTHAIMSCLCSLPSLLFNKHK